MCSRIDLLLHNARLCCVAYIGATFAERSE
jgi:hypothetical protein